MKTIKMLTILFLGFVPLIRGGRPAFAYKIVGWGQNFWGQARAPAGNDFVAISGDDRVSLALKSDGCIAGWGDNSYGQIDVPEGNDFVAISAGCRFCLAMKSDGSIVGWGDNSDGQIDVPEGNDFVAIDAGGFHGLALKSDGSIVGWGNQTPPPDGNDYVAIAAGWVHCLALKADGSVVAWGSPDTEPIGNDFVAITAGGSFSLALKSDGSIVGWGLDHYGKATPPTGNDFVAISAGHEHGLALKANGSVVAWGNNDFGQLNVPACNDFVAIDAGLYHCLSLAEIPMGTAFTYQGRLMDSNSPADGLYDFQFTLQNEAGFQKVEPIDVNDLDVIDGYFTLELDFGIDANAFNGYAQRLGISVRPGHSDDVNDFVVLSPSQQITPAPYALTATAALGLRHAGSETDAVYVDSAGNVGIGTMSPEVPLQLEITENTEAFKITSGNYDPIISLGHESPDGLIKGTLHNDLIIRSLANDAGEGIKFQDSGSNDLMFIEAAGGNAGNVGIGTSSPTSPLTVAGVIESTKGGVKFPDGTTQTSACIADGHSLDAADGSPTDAVYVDNDGKVGIGTPSPTKMLDVAGNIVAYCYYDRNNTDFYVKPAGTSICNEMQANVFRDRDNPNYYYVDPASTSTSANFAGNVYASRYIDRDRTNFCVDPSRISDCNYMDARIFRDQDDDRYFVDPAYTGVCAKLAGIVQLPGVYHTYSGGRVVRISSDGTLGTSEASSKRYKENISPLKDDFTKILGARTVTFTWKKSKDRGIGLIAEDLDELGLRDLVIYDAEGRPDGVRYEYISLYLLEVVKELKAENEALKEQLETQNQSVNKRLEALERIIRQSKLADVM